MFTQAQKLRWVRKSCSATPSSKDKRHQGRKNLNKLRVLDLCFDNCPCCNRMMDYSYSGKHTSTNPSASLDRVDTNLPYSDNNVAVICKDCNHRKNDAQHPDDLQCIADWWRIRLYMMKVALKARSKLIL